MRVLLGCSLGGRGHLTPVVAAARALARLGHEAVVLVPPSLSEAAADADVAFRVGDQPPQPVIDEIWERVRAGPREAVVGLVDRELFADRCTEAMLNTAREVHDTWRPEAVVREPCEYATAVVAHRAGIPQLQIGISQSAIEYGVLAHVADTLERHGRGVTDTIRAAPYLSPFPASLDPSPWPDTRRFRESTIAPRELPRWWPSDVRPLIYVTFGTVLGHLPEAHAVYRTALDAVGGLSARVLMTVGDAIDPDGLGEIPQNTRIERWVSQHDVFPHASLVVCHGGSGTTFGALAAGLPLVICPLFADQSANGRLAQDAGAATTLTSRKRPSGGLAQLGPDDVAPLRRAIEIVLAAPSYRLAAMKLARETTLTPTLEETLTQALARPTG